MMWTISAVFVPRDERTEITKQIWSIPIQGAALLMLFATIAHELVDLRLSYKRGKMTRALELKNLHGELQRVPEDMTWPDYEYFKMELIRRKQKWYLADYILDPWNYLDWSTYTLMLISGGSQIAGFIDSDSFNESFNENVLNLALIAAWTKMLKLARVSRTMGPICSNDWKDAWGCS